MIDDLIGELIGEAAFGRLSRSRRAQLVGRLFFGCLGAGLSVVGAIYMMRNPRTANALMHVSAIAMFLSSGAFWLFNVGMRRVWTWPAFGFALSFVLMFVSRIVLGR